MMQRTQRAHMLSQHFLFYLLELYIKYIEYTISISKTHVIPGQPHLRHNSGRFHLGQLFLQQLIMSQI